MTEENPIQLLTGIEEDIGRLYEAYARKIPEHEEFWFGFVLEEADHSNMVHSLVSKLHRKSLTFTTDPQAINKLKDLHNYLTQEKENLKKENLSFTEALQVAIEIENSIAKNGIYRLFTNPSGDVEETLEVLRHANASHIKFLRMELEKYSKKQ